MCGSRGGLFPEKLATINSDNNCYEIISSQVANINGMGLTAVYATSIKEIGQLG